MTKCGVKCVLILLVELLLGVGGKEDSTTLYEIPLYGKLDSYVFDKKKGTIGKLNVEGEKFIGKSASGNQLVVA